MKWFTVRSVSAAAAAVLLLAVPGALAETGEDGASRDRHVAVPGLMLVSESIDPLEPRLRTLTFVSEAYGGETRAKVLLPASYDSVENADQRYPVLMLFHGASGSENSWFDATDVEGMTAGLDLIVVTVDSDAIGFYTDWLVGPQYETMHLDEIFPYVEANYQGIGTREGRAVAGLSMGGFGATAYPARNPDLFLAAASFSGAVNIADGSLVQDQAMDSLGLGDDNRWGPYETKEINWRGHNPADLAKNLVSTDLHLVHRAGNPCPGDNPAAILLETATFLTYLGLRGRLIAEGVDHYAEEQACGTHEWHYWENDLQKWLPKLMDLFANPTPGPDTFDLKSADTTFAAWGWAFAVDRPVQEFVELIGVSEAGFQAVGSGTLIVDSAASYVPCQSYVVTTKGGSVPSIPVAGPPSVAAHATVPDGRTTMTELAADPDGRLHMEIVLGDVHDHDQYTPEARAEEAAANLEGGYFGSRFVSIAKAERSENLADDACVPDCDHPTKGHLRRAVTDNRCPSRPATAHSPVSR